MSDIVLTDAGLEYLDIAAHYSDLMNEEDGHPASPNNRKSLERLIREPNLGQVLLINLGEKVIGYVALCAGFSIEYGGPDICLDEIYIEREHRGKGYGLATLNQLAERVKAQGYVSFYLEVMAENPAVELYEKAGFEDRNSKLMTMSLIKDN